MPYDEFNSEFECKKCLFVCRKKSNFDKHLLTTKHLSQDIPLQAKEPKKYDCVTCDKNFTCRQSLHYHKKTCEKSFNSNNSSAAKDSENENFIRNLVLEIVKSNSELQRDMQKQHSELIKHVLDVCKTVTTNTTLNNVNNNNNNKTFNMQVFLNEHCKDAMNMKDFMNSIQLSLSDLELVGEKGFVEGISKIIFNSLRATEIHLRPFHCSDAKREVMYIKENNKWEKEGPKNEKIRLFVQNVEHKNIRLLVDYCKEHPDYLDPDSPHNDHYLTLSANATCATPEHIDKVISRIAKEVLIDK